MMARQLSIALIPSSLSWFRPRLGERVASPDPTLCQLRPDLVLEPRALTHKVGAQPHQIPEFPDLLRWNVGDWQPVNPQQMGQRL